MNNRKVFGLITLIAIIASSITSITLLPIHARAQEPVTVDGLGFDWLYSSCHALDPAGDLLDSTPDWSSSRDLLA